jgi:hypothetical protein
LLLLRKWIDLRTYYFLTDVIDHTSAAIQPSRVQPSSKFSVTIAPKL